MASMLQWSTELKDTGYITKADLQAKLKTVFEAEGCKPEEFKIATRSERWIYFSPRKLTSDELKDIIVKPDE